MSGLAALTGEPPTRAKSDFQTGGCDVYVYKPEMEKKYRNQLKMLENSDVPAEEKVLLIHDLYAEIGNGAEQMEFVRAGGVKLLTDFATREWPADGNLADSHAYVDMVVKCDATMHHTLRRVAVGCLAEMARYGPHALEMDRAGLFHKAALMLKKLCPKYRYGQTNKEYYGCGEGTDQSQFICIGLINICSGGQCADDVNADLFYNLGVVETIIKNYRPVDLPVHQHSMQDPEQYLCDPFPRVFIHFLAMATPLIGEQRHLKMIEWGVLEKLKKTPVPESLKSAHGYITNILEYARDKYKPKVEAKMPISAASLRLQGNDLFRGGKYGAAIKCYTKAIALSPQDTNLFSNRSLCFLKIGDLERALTDAGYSIDTDPERPKSWARLGDCFKAKGFLRGALLAYRMAVEISPQPDEEINARVMELEARVPVPEQLTVDQVPEMDQAREIRRFFKVPARCTREQLLAKMERQEPPEESAIFTYAGRSKADLARARGVVKKGIRKQQDGEWAISWTTVPGEDDDFPGLLRFLVTVMENENGFILSQHTCWGKPQAGVVLCALYRAMAFQTIGVPNRGPQKPVFLFVAYRLRDEYAAIRQAMLPLGVATTLESKAEAELTALRHGTNVDGYNHI